MRGEGGHVQFLGRTITRISGGVTMEVKPDYLTDVYNEFGITSSNKRVTSSGGGCHIWQIREHGHAVTETKPDNI